MRRAIFLLILGLLVTTFAAEAETFTVTLTNGSSFESRYQPKQAQWDDAYILLLNDVGNWMAVPKADIESIESASESRGFGRAINTTTIELGVLPNDAALAEEAAQSGNDPMDALAQMLQANQPAPVNFNQFVEPGQLQGMPGNWIGYPGTQSTQQNTVIVGGGGR
jgi:hypothetical protein